METIDLHPQAQTVTKNKIVDFTDAALQAVTNEMVTDIAAKVVTMIEIADDVIQPETIELLKALPEASKSLEKVLLEIKRLEENGTLTTVFHIVEMIRSLKSGLTGEMITGLMEKSFRGAEIADEMIQKGALDIVEEMLDAFQMAKQERQGKRPMTAFQLVRSLSNEETRDGISLLLTFVKILPKKFV